MRRRQGSGVLAVPEAAASTTHAAAGHRYLLASSVISTVPRYMGKGTIWGVTPPYAGTKPACENRG